MNADQLEAANKKFKMMYRFTDEYYKMYKEDIDKTDKFYEYYKDMYGDVEKIKGLSDETYERRQINIPYKPFDKFKEMANKECTNDEDLTELNLYSKGKQNIHNDLQYIEFSKDQHFYKTMDGFYTLDEEEKFIESNRNIPFWFSSPFLSYLTISARNGGINAYKAKSNVNVLIVNCDNMKKIINLIKDKEPRRMNFRNSTFDQDYVLDLCRLSSCSEKGFLDQLNIYNKFNKYGDDIWLTKEPLNGPERPCNMKVDNNDYFGIVKQKGKDNYNFAYMLAYLNKKYWNNKFDAYMIVEKYTPYFYTGVTLEEFVFFDPYDKLDRDTNDTYDWYQYEKTLDFKLHKNFRIPRLFSEYNKHFALYRFYDQNYMSKKNKLLKNEANGKTSIIYLDVNNFKSVNINDDFGKVKKELYQFVKFMDADIYLLLNAKNMNINNYERKTIDNANFYYKNKDIANQVKVLYSYIKQAKEFPYKRPFFKDFKETAKINYENNIKQISDVISAKPNIIFSKMKLTYNSPEFKHMADNDYNTQTIKTSIYPNDFDYVFTNLKFHKIDTLNYRMSYFIPIIVIV
jgi:hypothetical protein